MSTCDLSTCPPHLLVSSLGHLTKLDLQYCDTISVAGVKALLAQKQSKIKHLVLANSIDISSIEPKLLAERIVLLEKLELNVKNNLSKLQMEEIFRVVDTTKNVNLTTLSLWGCNLSSVPPAVLGRSCSYYS